MIYKFKDTNGTFTVENPQKYNLYFPLTNAKGTLLSSISPNLAGDIKEDNEHFLMQPAGIEDVRNNLLCRREFFIKKDDEIIRCSYPYKDTVECGLLYQKVTKRTKDLRIEILNFIPHNLKAEVMQVTMQNTSKKELRVTSTSFIPIFARAEKNLRDHRHVTSLLNRVELDKYGILVKPTMIFDERGHKVNETIYFILGYEGQKIAPSGQFPTFDYFFQEGDLIKPDAIEKDIKPANEKKAEFDGKEACAAFRFKERILKPGQISTFLFIMGMDENIKNIRNTFSKLDSPQKIKNAFQDTKNYWTGHLSNLSFDFKDDAYNNWLIWVKLQPTLRKLFGCSFLPHFDYGKGGRGWRDLWQDALALLLTENTKAKELILHNFKGVRIDGSNATVITNKGEFIPDRNCISRVWMDHGIWPYLTLSSYIHKNADLKILLEELSYFRDCQLKRAKEIDAGFKQKDTFLRARNGKVYKGSVVEHILAQTVVQFFNVGSHNIIRLENADWNDGLDMAAQNGESSAFSFMYAHNLTGICKLLNGLKTKTKSISLLKELKILLDRLDKPVNYANYKEKQKRLEEYLEKTKNISGEKVKIDIDDIVRDLEEKSKHMNNWLRKNEWLHPGFFNGYYDNKKKQVEGRHDKTMRMMLVPQVFAIMSGVASNEQIKNTWASIKKHLYDKKLKGFRLNTDFGSLYLELGRAFGFSYGDKENGAIFNHMVIMLANSLYCRGFIKEGHEAMDSIYNMSINEQAKIYPVLPEYFNRQGRGLYLYLTGSSSWYIHTLLEETLGIKFNYGDLVIEPKLVPQNFSRNTIEVKFALSGSPIRVIFSAAKTSRPFYEIKEIFFGKTKIIKENSRFSIRRKDLLENPDKIIKVHLH
ncbi:MAG: cellobiose phosphorylase [Candidatus Omnitrophica bacterium]|jgi:cellobiose phosphorylase|nr:cellobiose phosphorylase [Candidatus Omnitrophota bacterium]